MQTSRTLQIELPPPFPTNIFDHVVDGVAAVNSTSAGPECMNALIGVAYRYRAMHEAQRLVAGSLAVNRRGATADEKYVQDTQLAHFVFDGMACLEALCFAAYLVGHMGQGKAFPVHSGALQKVTPTSIEKVFRKQYPGTELAAALRDVSMANQFLRWRGMRNMMGRRSSPTARQGENGTRVLRFDLGQPIELETVLQSRIWLDDQVSLLLRQILGFLGSELKVLHAQPSPTLVR